MEGPDGSGRGAGGRGKGLEGMVEVSTIGLGEALGLRRRRERVRKAGRAQGGKAAGQGWVHRTGSPEAPGILDESLDVSELHFVMLASGSFPIPSALWWLPVSLLRLCMARGCAAYLTSLTFTAALCGGKGFLPSPVCTETRGVTCLWSHSQQGLFLASAS